MKIHDRSIVSSSYAEEEQHDDAQFKNAALIGLATDSVPHPPDTPPPSTYFTLKDSYLDQDQSLYLMYFFGRGLDASSLYVPDVVFSSDILDTSPQLRQLPGSPYVLVAKLTKQGLFVWATYIFMPSIKLDSLQFTKINDIIQVSFTTPVRPQLESEHVDPHDISSFINTTSPYAIQGAVINHQNIGKSPGAITDEDGCILYPPIPLVSRMRIKSEKLDSWQRFKNSIRETYLIERKDFPNPVLAYGLGQYEISAVFNGKPFHLFDDNLKTFYQGSNGTYCGSRLHNPRYVLRASTNVWDYVSSAPSSSASIPPDDIGSYNGEWIQIRLPKPILLHSYFLMPYASRQEEEAELSVPTRHALLASNDGILWVVLHDTHSSFSEWSATHGNWFYVHTCALYSIFRFVPLSSVFLPNTHHQGFRFRKFQLKAIADPQEGGKVGRIFPPTSFCFNNTIGILQGESSSTNDHVFIQTVQIKPIMPHGNGEYRALCSHSYNSLQDARFHGPVHAFDSAHSHTFFYRNLSWKDTVNTQAIHLDTQQILTFKGDWLQIELPEPILLGGIRIAWLPEHVVPPPTQMVVLGSFTARTSQQTTGGGSDAGSGGFLNWFVLGHFNNIMDFTLIPISSTNRLPPCSAFRFVFIEDRIGKGYGLDFIVLLEDLDMSGLIKYPPFTLSPTINHFVGFLGTYDEPASSSSIVQATTPAAATIVYKSARVRMISQVSGGVVSALYTFAGSSNLLAHDNVDEDNNSVIRAFDGSTIPYFSRADSYLPNGTFIGNTETRVLTEGGTRYSMIKGDFVEMAFPEHTMIDMFTLTPYRRSLPNSSLTPPLNPEHDYLNYAPLDIVLASSNDGCHWALVEQWTNIPTSKWIDRRFTTTTLQENNELVHTDDNSLWQFEVNGSKHVALRLRWIFPRLHPLPVSDLISPTQPQHIRCLSLMDIKCYSKPYTHTVYNQILNDVWHPDFEWVSGNLYGAGIDRGTYKVYASSFLNAIAREWNIFNSDLSKVWSSKHLYSGSSGIYNGMVFTQLNQTTRIKGEWIELHFPFSGKQEQVFNQVEYIIEPCSDFNTAQHGSPFAWTLLVRQSNTQSWKVVHSVHAFHAPWDYPQGHRFLAKLDHTIYCNTDSTLCFRWVFTQTRPSISSKGSMGITIGRIKLHTHLENKEHCVYLTLNTHNGGILWVNNALALNGSMHSVALLQSDKYSSSPSFSPHLLESSTIHSLGITVRSSSLSQQARLILFSTLNPKQTSSIPINCLQQAFIIGLDGQQQGHAIWVIQNNIITAHGFHPLAAPFHRIEVSPAFMWSSITLMCSFNVISTKDVQPFLQVDYLSYDEVFSPSQYSLNIPHKQDDISLSIHSILQSDTVHPAVHIATFTLYKGGVALKLDAITVYDIKVHHIPYGFMHSKCRFLDTSSNNLILCIFGMPIGQDQRNHLFRYFSLQKKNTIQFTLDVTAVVHSFSVAYESDVMVIGYIAPSSYNNSDALAYSITPNKGFFIMTFPQHHIRYVERINAFDYTAPSRTILYMDFDPQACALITCSLISKQAELYVKSMNTSCLGGNLVVCRSSSSQHAYFIDFYAVMLSTSSTGPVVRPSNDQMYLQPDEDDVLDFKGFYGQPLSNSQMWTLLVKFAYENVVPITSIPTLSSHAADSTLRAQLHKASVYTKLYEDSRV